MKIRYFGAACGAGGSVIAVDCSGRRILLDCGRPMGRVAADNASPSLVDPAEADAIILTHAHQDHAGWLTEFVEHGFRGMVFATPATIGLVRVQLAESAARRAGADFVEAVIRGERIARPLASPGGIDFVPVEAGRTFDLPSGAVATLNPAGHLLGAVGAAVTWRGARLYFTGDLGRDDSPLYLPPAPIPDADLVVAEATYGDRDAEPFADAAYRLGAIAREASEEGGRVIIPAFSLGRTQLVLVAIHRLRRSGLWPDVPVVVDSPTARRFAEVHREFASELRDPELVRACDDAQYIESEADSADFATGREPAVVIVSGGMADSVRARRHIKARVDDPRAKIVLVSFQAPGTLGRRLLERGPTVRIDGRNWNKWADVVQLCGFSGHAGRTELIRSLTATGRRGASIRLVHGDRSAAESLALALHQQGVADVAVPRFGDADRLRPADGI
jgi:metallo-beta-lactamase family protein